MKLFLTIFAITFLSLVSGFSLANDRPELGHAVYTYGSCSADPMQVNVIRYGEKSEKKFLVQITGIDHELNGDMLVYNVEELESTKLKYRFTYRNDDELISSLLFNGGDGSVDLYIRKYAGLYTPEGRLPENYRHRLCLKSSALDPLQFHRRLETQKAKLKESNS